MVRVINVVGWQSFALLVVVLTVVSGGVAFLLETPSSLIDFLSLFSKVGFVLSLVIVGIGQSPVFAFLCKYRPLNLVFPDIDGEWHGETSSNWPTIAKTYGITDPDGNPFNETTTPVRADICVKLLSISIELHSNSGYQNSKTVSCVLKRNSHRGFELSYIYRSFVPGPKTSDDQSFVGAGLIDFSSKKPDQLSGVYWTNRKWIEGLNTAGEIVLKREIVEALGETGT